MNALKKIWRRLTQPPRAIVRDLPIMSEKQIREALRVPEDNALWQALNQVIEKAAEDCTEDALDIDAADAAGRRGHHSGGAHPLRRLQDFLIETRADAMREVEEME